MNNLTKHEKQHCIEVLQTLVRSGIMTLDEVLGKDIMTKREKTERMHTYSLTPPSKEGGRWQTRVKDGDKVRNIKANSKEELLDKLADIYFANSYLDNLTFYGLYLEWLEYKKGITSSPNTILRHQQHYKKYFAPSALHDAKITELDELILETECNSIVKNFDLTRKEWNNIKTILNGMFEYAVRKKYLSDSPLMRVRINVKFRQVNHKPNTTQVFIAPERKAYMAYLNKQFEETGDTSYLAEYINFYFGLRVGELVALKWSDIWGGQLHVVREEVRDQTVNPHRYKIVEHTKTHTDRSVEIPAQAQAVLDCIPRTGEYIFVRNGERITSIRIQTINYRYAQRTGKQLLSSHAVRRTYASELHCQGVPLKVIQEQLGHSSIMTTEKYIYNVDTPETTSDLIANAFRY